MALPQLDPAMMQEPTNATDTTPQIDPAMMQDPAALVQPNLGDQSSTQPEVLSETLMTPEEMKADLDEMLSMLQKKAADVKGNKTTTQAAMEESKRKVMGLFFDILQRAGVDPNNVESIGQFIEQLSQQDPDLAQLFEQVFNMIAGGPAPEEQPPQLMDKFKNLGQEMMMPRQ